MKKILAGLLLALTMLGAQAQTFTVQNLQVNGVITGATGGIALTSLATEAANTVVANVTNASASPTAFAMPSCSTSTSALQYTSATGFTCLGTSANLTGAQFTGAVGLNYPNATTPIQLTWFNNGSSRWIWQNDGVAETGANAGSNLTLNSRTDAGSFLATVMTVNRASGTTGLAGLSMVGAITPNQTIGLVGTTTNNNANAGSWGEYNTATSATVSMTTGVPVACASVSLPAGDYDISGSITFTPAGTTTVSGLYSGVNQSVAVSTGNNGLFTVMILPFSTGQQQLIATPVSRQLLSGTTTVNLVGQALFGVSTMTCNGFLRYRRIR